MCFLKLLGSILGGVWGAFCIQKPAWREKCIFLKMSVSYTRELNFGGSGVPEALPKASENRSQNVVDFFIEKTVKKERKWAPKRPPKPIKKRPETSLKKRLKKVRFLSPKMYAKSFRVAATKLRLRRRPPTKDDPQKENHTRTNATFPGAHHARAPSARSGSQLPSAITRSGPGEDKFPRTG